MRIWFVGGGAFAASCLARLSERFSFDKIVTGQPTKAGRGLKDRVSQVERTAEELGLAALLERTGPLSRNEKLTEIVSADPPDLMFVVDFGQVIREPFLNGPRHGCLNIHPSLLPRWRGAAPVQRALMNGDERTGVTVFRLVEEMDAGPILAQAEAPITLETTSEELFETLARVGSQIAIRSVESLEDPPLKGSPRFSAQNPERTTYAAKLTKEEAEVSWTQNYLHAHNVVRAFASSSGAFVCVCVGAGGTKNTRLKLWHTTPIETNEENEAGRPGQVLRFWDGDPVVACKGGALRLKEVQNEGKRRVGGAEWACGSRLEVGGVLG
jgi:methionyl-tRNA formyltransferase